MKEIDSILIALFFFSCLTSIGQQNEKNTNSESKFKVSGSMDAYFRTNLNGPNGEDAVAPGSSFANLSGFALGMLNVVGKYETKKVGIVADFVFGPRGEDATFNSPLLRPGGSSNIINQLYVYWNVSETIQFTFGNFNTFLGYEVISPVSNFNYSTSYLFSYGPFSHTGIKADFNFTENLSLMLAVLNPTDATEFNPFGKYAFGAQLSYTDQFLNILVDDDSFELDFTGGFHLSDTFYFGINGAIHKEESKNIGFVGLAIYPQISASETVTLGLRGEYFKEIGVFGAIGTSTEDSSVYAVTATANIKVGELTITPELRLDSSSEDFFLDKDLISQKNLSSFVLATTYKF